MNFDEDDNEEVHVDQEVFDLALVLDDEGPGDDVDDETDEDVGLGDLGNGTGLGIGGGDDEGVFDLGKVFDLEEDLFVDLDVPSVMHKWRRP